MKTIALFRDNFFEKKPVWLPKKLHRVICERSNPRTKSYMTSLLKQHFLHAEICENLNIKLIANATVVLLYQDAIGLGWSKLEKLCLKHAQTVMVINGRRRKFQLTRSTRRKLLLRRFLEITFLLEMLTAPVLLLAGSILALTDKISRKVS